MATEQKIKLLSFELRQEVEKLVKDRFEDDRRLLKEVLGGALKILAYATALIAIIITLFGVKTFADVDEAVRKAAVEQVSKKLRVEDPDSTLSTSVESILSRAVLDSNLISISRQTADFSASRATVRLSTGDVTRLFGIMNRVTTNQIDFDDVLRVLNAADGTDLTRRRIMDELYDFLAAGEASGQGWVVRQPEKRVNILRIITKEGLGEPARGLLRDSTTQLRSAAVRYLAQTGNKEAIPDLSRLAAGDPSPTVRVNALAALAQLAPQNSELSKAVAAITSSTKLDMEQKANGLYILGALLAPPLNTIVSKDSDLEHRRVLAISLIRIALESKIKFELRPLSAGFGSRSEGYQLTATDPDRPDDLYEVPNRIVVSRANDPLSIVLTETASSGDTVRLAKYVRMLSVRDPWIRSNPAIVVRLWFRNGGGLDLDNGSKVGPDNAPSGVILQNDSTDQTRLVAVWADVLGNQRRGIITGMQKAQTFQFEVVPRQGYLLREL